MQLTCFGQFIDIIDNGIDYGIIIDTTHISDAG